MGQRLDKELIKCLKDNLSAYTNAGRALSPLLKINHLPNEVIMILLRPWYRANMLAAWCKKVSWTDEKERAKTLVKTIKSLKRQLVQDPQHIVILMLFMTSSEPDTGQFLSNLDELQKFLEIFISFDFKNGSPYSTQYFIRYAINSLFYMGKVMGLKETGVPTQINQYVHVVTERVYEEINKDSMKFNKMDFVDNFNKQKNTPLPFIFDPYCPSNKDVLTNINRLLTA
jgi:hypothetical protein